MNIGLVSFLTGEGESSSDLDVALPKNTEKATDKTYQQEVFFKIRTKRNTYTCNQKLTAEISL